jgi:hypothetical protein
VLAAIIGAPVSAAAYFFLAPKRTPRRKLSLGPADP